MKAVAVFPGKQEVSLIEDEPPKISAPAEVRLRMLEVEICGTDKEICAFQYGTPPPGFEYLVIGHESLGEVIEIGPEASHLQVGDLVVPMVRRPCPHDRCLACRSGSQDFCYTGDFTERGIQEAHGFMTEFVVDEEKYMNPVPRELREAAVRDLGIFMTRWPDAVRSLLTGRYPIAAYRDLLLGKPGGIKNVIALE